MDVAAMNKGRQIEKGRFMMEDRELRWAGPMSTLGRFVDDA